MRQQRRLAHERRYDLSRSKLAALGGAAGVLAGLVWLILTPFMATVFICDPVCLDWTSQPLLVRTVGKWLAAEGAFTYAGATDVYFDYGRFFPLFYLLATVALGAFQSVRTRDRHTVNPLQRWSFRVMMAGFVISGLGDFASYTLGRYSGVLWSVGFGVEVIAWVIVIPAMIAYGVAILRDSEAPRWHGWGFIVAAVAMPLSFLDRWLVTYMPNAQLMVLAGFCVALGAALLRGGRKRVIVAQGQ